LSLVLSVVALRAGRYRSTTKYFCFPFEAIGLLLVMASTTLQGENYWAAGIKNPNFFAVFFIFQAQATLRFSPRFAWYTGILSALSYLAAAVLVVATTPVQFQG